MDEEIERLVVSVRADTSGFARDVGAMRTELEGPLVWGAGRAGRMIVNALTRAVTTGKLGFDDLKRVALSAMAEIAQASLRSLFSASGPAGGIGSRSEEHTSELQSRQYLVCRLLLEKKKKTIIKFFFSKKKKNKQKYK